MGRTVIFRSEETTADNPVDAEIACRERFLQLYHELGDELLADIRARIVTAAPPVQQTVFELIGAESARVFHEVINHQEVSLNLRTLRVETVYRVWRTLESLSPAQPGDVTFR